MDWSEDNVQLSCFYLNHSSVQGMCMGKKVESGSGVEEYSFLACGD